MKGQPPLSADAGFTLVESMLALTILSISLLAVAKLQVHALQGNALSRRITLAVAIAEQKAEQLKTTPYDSLQAESATTVTVSNLTFTRQVLVTAGPIANTKAVSVLVTWQEQAKTHTVPLATVIAKPLGG